MDGVLSALQGLPFARVSAAWPDRARALPCATVAAAGMTAALYDALGCRIHYDVRVAAATDAQARALSLLALDALRDAGYTARAVTLETDAALATARLEATR